MRRWETKHFIGMARSSKGFSRIPFTVKHITKCLCFRLKNEYKSSMVTMTSLECQGIDLLGNFRGRDDESTLRLYIKNISYRTIIIIIIIIIISMMRQFRPQPSLHFKPICNLQSAFFTDLSKIHACKLLLFVVVCCCFFHIVSRCFTGWTISESL